MEEKIAKIKEEIEGLWADYEHESAQDGPDTNALCWGIINQITALNWAIAILEDKPAPVDIQQGNVFTGVEYSQALEIFKSVGKGEIR